MLRGIIVACLVIVLLPYNAYSKEATYFDMVPPAMEGAENVERKKNEQFYAVSLSYDITIKDTGSVFDFYDNYFKEQGWEQELEQFKGKKWPSHGIHYSETGAPVFECLATWKRKNVPINGAVSLALSGYKQGYFSAKVTVSLVPDINDIHLMDLSEFYIKDPRNVFVLYEAIGNDPFSYKNIDLNLIPKELEGEPVVREYKKQINSIISVYKEFGGQYVLGTKPVDGRFLDSHFDSSTSDEYDKKLEDSLAEWRRLQEERVEKQMEARKSRLFSSPENSGSGSD